MKNLLSCLFVCAILLLSKAVCAQIPEEIIITANSYIAPLSFSGWATENPIEASAPGAGAASAGNAYSKYREKIAKQNACLDKKNKLAAAADKKEQCNNLNKLTKLYADKGCTTITEASLNVGAGIDKIVTFTVGGTLKWNPRETCLSQNSNQEAIDNTICNTDFNSAKSKIDFQYSGLNCN